MKKIIAVVFLLILISSVIPLSIDANPHNPNTDYPLCEIQDDTFPVNLSESTHPVVSNIAFSLDNQYVAYGGYDDKVYIHWTSNWTKVTELTESSDHIYGIDWSPNGNWIAYCTGGFGKVYVHTTSDWSKVATLQEQESSQINEVAFSPDSSYIAYTTAHPSVNSVPTVFVHSTGGSWTNQTMIQEDGVTNWASDIEWSPSGSYLAFSTLSNETCIYNSVIWTKVTELKFPGSIGYISWSPNGSYIASTRGFPNYKVYINNTGGAWSHKQTLSFSDVPVDVEFSPNGKWIAVGCYDDNIYVYNTSNWENIGIFTYTNNQNVRSVVFSNNNLLAYSGNDYKVIVKNVYDSTRVSGASSESNDLVFTPTYNMIDNVTLKIPLSTDVQGIINVTNNTGGGLATEVNGTDELVNDTFWYDSANNFLHIRTINLTTSSSVDWTVLATYGMTFSLIIPPYLTVGQYFRASGLIENSTGHAVSGVIATTRLLYSNGTDALPVNPRHNCIGGNYECVFSTAVLSPGVYDVSIEFTDAGITYKEGGTLYLSYDTPTGVYSDALVFFNFYNTNEGLGLPTETLKIYVDAVRQYENTYYAYTNQEINITIKDYYSTTLYSANHTIVNSYTFLDFGLTFHSYKFCNKNERYYMISLLKEGGSRWYERAVCPYETIEYVLPTGNYTLRIYNHTDDEVYNSTLPPSLTVNRSIVYELHGTNLSEILDGQSMVVGILENQTEYFNESMGNWTDYWDDWNDDWTDYWDNYTFSDNESVVAFNFYNTNQGLGLDRETLLIYIDGNRLLGNLYFCHNNTSFNLTVKDFYNFTLYQNDFTVDEQFEFIDLGLTFHSWLFGNKNDDWYMVSLLKDGATRWWERGIVPYGEREFMIPSGNYTMRIYDKDYVELINTSFAIVNSRVFVIHGTNLSEIISGLSVIRGQLLDDLAFYFMPDVTSICRNIPYIYSSYQCEGVIAGGYRLVCPYQAMTATTKNETVDNNFISYPLVPTNGTTANGTIRIISDRIYFAGSASWVNISYDGEYANISYVPSFIDPFGADVTINASSGLAVTRETKFQQVKKFNWMAKEDINYYETTVHFENVLNTVLRQIYCTIEFANDDMEEKEIEPDYPSVSVYDVTNGLYMTSGSNFQAEATGITFYIPAIDIAETRSFTCTHETKNPAEISTDAIESVDYYDMENLDNKNYYHCSAQWTNPKSIPFIGSLYIKFNFSTDPYEIASNSFVVYDKENNRYLYNHEFAFQGPGLTISQDVMGSVAPNHARSFDVYFLFVSESIDDSSLPTKEFLHKGIFQIPLVGWWFEIFHVLCLFCAFGIGYPLMNYFDKKTEKKKRNLYISVLAAVFLLLFIIAYIQGV